MPHTMKWILVATTLFVVTTGCGHRQTSLQIECRNYLEAGPPAHMEDYVPGSLTEIVIAHGAKGASLDPELVELGEIIVMESESLSDVEDPAIREYMQQGADLVRRVVEANQ
ncbi:hypothetical protein NG895_22790 [Aeoliella sp. ICT_H6.2]|uniref:Uncharacterized protein n=1 Tax=Aeoliella straminimaris TaxID=2954799 RepID=A0A9X2FDP8_9BACT|nr:hypothetical protein [Aeoliella straminimaris]MCO6046734.1 hypothetical protein [Aeoliella straminimaris]